MESIHRQIFLEIPKRIELNSPISCILRFSAQPDKVKPVTARIAVFDLPDLCDNFFPDHPAHCLYARRCDRVSSDGRLGLAAMPL